MYPTKDDKDPIVNFPNKMKTPPRPSTNAYSTGFYIHVAKASLALSKKDFPLRAI